MEGEAVLSNNSTFDAFFSETDPSGPGDGGEPGCGLAIIGFIILLFVFVIWKW